MDRSESDDVTLTHGGLSNQVGHGMPDHASVMQVLHQLDLLNQSMEDLASVMIPPSQGAGASDDQMYKAYLENAIDYTDERPDVEVSVRVLSASDLDIRALTFKAEIVVCLDWEERNFEENVHYTYDRGHRPVLGDQVLDDMNAFDPKVYIDNMVVNDSPHQEEPKRRIHRVVHHSSGDDHSDHCKQHVSGLVKRQSSSGLRQTESLWLTKEYRFSGVYKIQRTDARHFPFDIHRLQIEIRSKPLPGLSTLNEPLTVQLVDPRLRPLEKLAKQQEIAPRPNNKRSAGIVPLVVQDNADLLLSQSNILAHEWEMKKDMRRGNAAVDENLIEFNIGEHALCAFGGARSGLDEYHLELVVARDCTRFLVDFLIFSALLCVAGFSVFVPFTPDVLAARLTITITALLTLITLTVQRPTQIASLSYTTTYDLFLKLTVFGALIVGVQNWVVSVECWGAYRYGLDDQVFERAGGTGWFFEAINACHFRQESTFSFGSSIIDDYFFLLLLISEILFSMAIIGANVLHQVRFILRVYHEINSVTLRVHNEIHSSVKDESTHRAQQRLIIRSHFEFVKIFSPKDLPLSLSYTAMFAALFPRLWLWAADPLNTTCCRYCFCSCCCCHRRRHSLRRVAPEELPTFTHVKTGASEAHADSEEDEVGPWVLPFWGKRPHIEADEITFICDVGTGEIGIWELRKQKVANFKDKRLLFMTGEKIAYSTNTSFLEFFVRARDGVEKFSNRLIQSLDKSGCQQALHGFKRSRKKTKILVGSTGANRQTLRNDPNACHDVEKWIKSVSDELQNNGYNCDLVFFIPKAEDEANFELLATEWLVQNGDLDVTKIEKGANHEPFAGLELTQALLKAMSQNKPQALSGLNLLTLEEYMREFRDFVDDDDCTMDFLKYKFHEAANLSSVDRADVADVGKLVDAFRNSPKLMRSLVKHRLFSGTVSAGGGSCQITFRSMDGTAAGKVGTATCKVVSVALGNKYPMVSVNGSAVIFDPSKRITSEMLETWRQRVKDACKDVRARNETFQMKLRGLFIGISAIFYAASKAKCAELILPRNAFIERLEAKLVELLESPGKPKRETQSDGREVEKYDHRDIANLVLVSEVVKRMLHKTAWIVCKRQWKNQPAVLEMYEDLAEAEEEIKGRERSAEAEEFDEHPNFKVANSRKSVKSVMHAQLIEDALYAEGHEIADSAIERAQSEVPVPLVEEKELPTYVAGWVLGFYLNQTLRQRRKTID